MTDAGPLEPLNPDDAVCPPGYVLVQENAWQQLNDLASAVYWWCKIHDDPRSSIVDRREIDAEMRNRFQKVNQYWVEETLRIKRESDAERVVVGLPPID